MTKDFIMTLICRHLVELSRTGTFKKCDCLICRGWHKCSEQIIGQQVLPSLTVGVMLSFPAPFFLTLFPLCFSGWRPLFNETVFSPVQQNMTSHVKDSRKYVNVYTCVCVYVTLWLQGVDLNPNYKCYQTRDPLPSRLCTPCANRAKWKYSGELRTDLLYFPFQHFILSSWVWEREMRL